MSDLTANPTNPIPATVPALTDGTIPHATNFHAQTQALLDAVNRTAARVVADFTALRAVSNQVPGERMFVQGYGLYEWRASDVTAEASPWIISPGGTGRWWHALVSIAGSVNGLATLDPNGRVVQVPHNAIVGTDYLETTGNQSTTSNAFADYASSTRTLGNVQTGDYVDIDLDLLTSVTSDTLYVRLVCTENGGGDIAPSEWIRFISGSRPLSMSVRRTVVDSGPFTVRLQIRNNDNSTSQTVELCSFRITAVRP